MNILKKIVRSMVILVFVVLIGSIYLFYNPHSHTLKNNYESQLTFDNQSLIELSQKSKEHIYNKKTEVDIDYEAVSEDDFNKAQKEFNNIVHKSGIGRIYIPIDNGSWKDVKLPVLSGPYEQNLYVGISSDQTSMRIGEGFFVGLIHSLDYVKKEPMFKYASEINIGDLIYMTDFDKIYIYETIEQKVVHESEAIHLMEAEKIESLRLSGQEYGTPQLLLYRCEGTVGTPYRRIVYGTLKEEKDFKDYNNDKDRFILEGLGFNFNKDTKIEDSFISNIAKITIYNDSSFYKNCVFISSLLLIGLIIIDITLNKKS